MTVTQLGKDGFIVTGEHIPYYRLCALRARLKLEIAGICFKGPPIGSAVRATIGSKTVVKRRLLEELEAYIAANRPGVARSVYDNEESLEYFDRFIAGDR